MFTQVYPSTHTDLKPLQQHLPRPTNSRTISRKANGTPIFPLPIFPLPIFPLPIFPLPIVLLTPEAFSDISLPDHSSSSLRRCDFSKDSVSTKADRIVSDCEL